MLEVLAELVNIELETASSAASYAYLVKVSKVLIHSAYEVFVRESLAYAALELSPVVAVIQQNSIRTASIAPGTACLLEVSFNRVRAVNMHNQPHVGLVYAHAEGVCSHHNPHLVVLPQLLPLVPYGVFKSGIIESGAYAAVIEHLGDFLRALPASCINDCRTVNLVKKAHRVVLFVARLTNYVSKVLALKTHPKDVLLLETEPVLDVVHHARSGCCRERKYRNVWLYAAYLADFKV